MRSFAEILATAQLHRGGYANVEADLPIAKTPAQLAEISDDRYLSLMSLRVFQAGLKHDLVLSKWPNFERVFQHFDPFHCAMLSDEDLESCMQYRDLIRHLGKLKAIRENARFVREVVGRLRGFGHFIAEWPSSEIVDLWLYLRKHGCQLGGLSAPRFLRMAGKDTFLLTDDVVAVLRAEGVLNKAPTSKRDLYAAQSAFNHWARESGRPLCEISRIVSMNAGGH
jgi:3-methyladenine DNA glycosylase Tag